MTINYDPNDPTQPTKPMPSPEELARMKEQLFKDNPDIDPEFRKILQRFLNSPSKSPEEIAAIEKESWDRDTKSIWDKADIPEIFKNAWPHSPQWESCLEAVRKIIDVSPPGALLLICGEPKSGKSSLGVAAIAHLCAKYHRLGYFSRLKEYLHSIQGKDVDRQWLTEHYEWPYLLVLDNVELLGSSHWEEGELLDLLTGRFNQAKHSILLFGGSPADAQAKLTSAILNLTAKDTRLLLQSAP